MILIFRAAYWETYKLDVEQDDDDETVEEEIAPGWNCGTCTFRNEPTFTRCSMCDTARPESADDWSLTGIAGKKQRKVRFLTYFPLYTISYSYSIL